MSKDLTKIADLSKHELVTLIDSAVDYKRKHDLWQRNEETLRGRVVALVFEKPSLRTKVAFEVAITALGGTPIFLSSSQILASGSNERGRESVPDIARNLERFADFLVARVYSHDSIIELARSVRVPVINALCDRHHPTQALADIMAMRVYKGAASGLHVAYVGDGNNVATSLVQACAMVGHHVRIASPRGYEIPVMEQSVAQDFASASGVTLRFGLDPKQAVTGADVVYTDTFVSMGQESEKSKRAAVFTRYQVNQELMQLAKPDAVFMHCLPAHRGEEVTSEVMDSAQSIVFDQAECRLHVAKAVLAKLSGVVG